MQIRKGTDVISPPQPHSFPAAPLYYIWRAAILQNDTKQHRGNATEYKTESQRIDANL